MKAAVKKPELLLPAGSLSVLKTAIRYGADAVYVGGEAFSLRAKAENFSMEELREGIHYAHNRGVRVYVTANIYAHNADLSGIRAYFTALSDTGLDGILVSDPGVLLLARELLPKTPIHISTQANTTNYESVRFWHGQGVRRVVCARELSLSEISALRREIPADMEIEAFVHGAMCMAYSGRCLLSAYLTGREANQGACTHPCRWKYQVVEETRPGQFFPVYENERGTYLFHAKDLCMLEHIPELLSAGVDSFKVEGRMKTALYVATVARCYRRAIDDYFQGQSEGLDSTGASSPYEKHLPWYRKEIERCTHRSYSTGFYFGKPDETGQVYGDIAYRKGAVYLGTVERVDAAGNVYLTQKNKFSVGDTLEIMKPDGKDLTASVLEIRDAESGIPQDACPHAKQRLKLRLSQCPEEGDLLRFSLPEAG